MLNSKMSGKGGNKLKQPNFSNKNNYQGKIKQNPDGQIKDTEKKPQKDLHKPKNNEVQAEKKANKEPIKEPSKVQEESKYDENLKLGKKNSQKSENDKQEKQEQIVKNDSKRENFTAFKSKISSEGFQNDFSEKFLPEARKLFSKALQNVGWVFELSYNDDLLFFGLFLIFEKYNIDNEASSEAMLNYFREKISEGSDPKEKIQGVINLLKKNKKNDIEEFFEELEIDITTLFSKLPPKLDLQAFIENLPEDKNFYVNMKIFIRLIVLRKLIFDGKDLIGKSSIGIRTEFLINHLLDNEKFGIKDQSAGDILYLMAFAIEVPIYIYYIYFNRTKQFRKAKYPSEFEKNKSLKGKLKLFNVEDKQFFLGTRKLKEKAIGLKAPVAEPKANQQLKAKQMKTSSIEYKKLDGCECCKSTTKDLTEFPECLHKICRTCIERFIIDESDVIANMILDTEHFPCLKKGCKSGLIYEKINEFVGEEFLKTYLPILAAEDPSANNSKLTCGTCSQIKFTNLNSSIIKCLNCDIFYCLDHRAELRKCLCACVKCGQALKARENNILACARCQISYCSGCKWNKKQGEICGCFCRVCQAPLPESSSGKCEGCKNTCEVCLVTTSVRNFIHCSICSGHTCRVCNIFGDSSKKFTNRTDRCILCFEDGH